jgi:Alkylmercury lyase
MAPGGDEWQSRNVVHFAIMQSFVAHGHPPARAALDGAALDALAAEHGVVLHPSGEVWIAHPFSASPTATWVDRGDRGWWAPCLWCALGIVTLCAPHATIHARLGGERAPIAIEASTDVVIHFPIPARAAWDNVVHWCASVQPFACAEDVAPWAARHAMPVGAIVPIAQVRALAARWYGRHLDRDWKKWTLAEAQAHFDAVGLTGDHWRLPTGTQRY